jgi:putative ABC transport system permease protein
MRRIIGSYAAVATMALGIGAATAIFSLVHPLLLHPFTFSNPDELVTIEERDPSGRTSPVSYPDFRDWSAQRAALLDTAAFDIGFFELTNIDNPEEIPGALVTTNLFHVLGVAPALGRDFRDGEEGSVILTDAAWRKRFGGDPDILGRNIALDFARTPEIERYTVIGVMPPNFWMYYGNFEVFVPLERRFIREDRNARGLIAIGRRARGVSVEQAQAALNTIPLDPEFSATVRPWEKAAIAPVRSELLLLAAAAGLLLLIASANVAGLLLVRAQARRSEIAIRAALGASPSRLMRLLLGDSARVAILAAVLGGGIAWWAVKTMMAVLPPDIETTRFLPGLNRVAVDPAALAFAATAALVACFLAGLVPAWQARSADLTAGLKDGSGQRARQALVMVEVALSVVLLAGAGLLLKSLDQIRTVDLGFRADHLLILRVPRPHGRSSHFYSEIALQVSELPGVRSEALYSSLTGRAREGFQIPERGEKFATNYIMVEPGYFETFGIPMRRGRAFDDGDRVGVGEHVVINEAMARRHWPNEDPIGRTLIQEGQTVEIIGVCADTRPQIFREPEPTVYQPLAGTSVGQMAVRTVGDPLAAAPAVTHLIRDLGGVVAEVGTMEHFVENNTWQHEQATTLLTIFAALALILSGVGLYGVISFAVGRRTREIGIRVALGATRANIIRLVLLEGFRPVFAGLIVGLAAAGALSRFVAALLYRVAPADPVVLGMAAIVCGAAAFIACAIPMRRALRIDPMIALRQD